MTKARTGAFLALWNSISSPQLQPEYETWHAFEHVPERVGLPGFIEARRYRAHDDGPQAQPPRYFTCYWLASLDALATAEYQDVLTRPTPWSARIRLQLRDFLRLPCTVEGACGTSTATQLATLHLRGDAIRFSALVTTHLQQMVGAAQIICGHWGTVAAPDSFHIPNANATANAPAGAGTDFVMMMQAIDRASLRIHTHETVLALSAVAKTVSAPAFFELQSQVRQDELTHPLTTRQPARTALFQTFKPTSQETKP